MWRRPIFSRFNEHRTVQVAEKIAKRKAATMVCCVVVIAHRVRSLQSSEPRYAKSPENSHFVPKTVHTHTHAHTYIIYIAGDWRISHRWKTSPSTTPTMIESCLISSSWGSRQRATPLVVDGFDREACKHARSITNSTAGVHILHSHENTKIFPLISGE